MTDSSSNLNLNLYEPVSIINYQKGKCNRFLQKRGRGSAAGCGLPAQAGCVEKVLKMDRPMVGGFLGLTASAAPRVVDCR